MSIQPKLVLIEKNLNKYDSEEKLSHQVFENCDEFLKYLKKEYSELEFEL